MKGKEKSTVENTEKLPIHTRHYVHIPNVAME